MDTIKLGTLGSFFSALLLSLSLAQAAPPGDVPPVAGSLVERVAALEAMVAALQTALAAEEAARIAADDAEAAARTNDVTTLNSALIFEEKARQKGDSLVQNTLQTALDNETSARIAGDNNLQSQIDTLDTTALEARVTSVEETLTCASYDATNMDFVLDGCNVHVRNGAGSTDSINGLGNLIVGYDAERVVGSDKTGSHNMVIGDEHNYSSYGGLVAGFRNTITGAKASVSGGAVNIASGINSSVSGGFNNKSSGIDSSVSGGRENTASEEQSSVSGGHGCVAADPRSWGVGDTDHFTTGCANSNAP